MPNENEVVPLTNVIGDPPTPPKTGMSAAINLTVTTADKTYALAVGIPTGSAGVYSFTLTETDATNKDMKLADFQFLNDTNFLIDISIPSVSSDSGTTVSGGFLISEGTVPST